VVVAVPVVGVVQVSGDGVVDVIAVRDRLVTAALTMNVISAVRIAGVLGRAVVWVGTADREAMLIYMIAVHAVQVAVV